ncbi:hypothetical protein F3Y22_tig00111588pilonHSYRG00005 [Hibiscus syriacus]|uniref:Uncharacterized protein n=1 Tax=Hibiscus syriacus TaxID=106335 RepID=A0A6A2Y5P8_HIBSY|nr:hypothetical protein F3Y22_tig00111588pilonHSYRG00005 [Hibiscus syriacus]
MNNFQDHNPIICHEIRESQFSVKVGKNHLRAIDVAVRERTEKRAVMIIIVRRKEIVFESTNTGEDEERMARVTPSGVNTHLRMGRVKIEVGKKGFESGVLSIKEVRSWEPYSTKERKEKNEEIKEKGLGIENGNPEYHFGILTLGNRDTQGPSIDTPHEYQYFSFSSEAFQHWGIDTLGMESIPMRVYQYCKANIDTKDTRIPLEKLEVSMYRCILDILRDSDTIIGRLEGYVSSEMQKSFSRIMMSTLE